MGILCRIREHWEPRLLSEYCVCLRKSVEKERRKVGFWSDKERIV